MNDRNTNDDRKWALSLPKRPTLWAAAVALDGGSQNLVARLKEAIEDDELPAVHLVRWEGGNGQVNEMETTVRCEDLVKWREQLGQSIDEGAPARAGDVGNLSLGKAREQTLLKQIAALALCIAEHGKKYKRGDKPNVNQIATAALVIVEAREDFKSTGLAASSLRASITGGLDLLNGKMPADGSEDLPAGSELCQLAISKQRTQ
jgi:hypothetical protein